MRLRQPRVRGTICLRHGGSPNGEGGDCFRPCAWPGEGGKLRSGIQRQGESTTWPFRETQRPRKSLAEWDAPWASALRTWSTRSISICMWSAEECRARGRHFRPSSLKNCGSAPWSMPQPLLPLRSLAEKGLRGMWIRKVRPRRLSLGPCWAAMPDSSARRNCHDEQLRFNVGASVHARAEPFVALQHGRRARAYIAAPRLCVPPGKGQRARSPYLTADFNRVTSCAVRWRNFPGGTSSCSGP